MMNGRGRVLEWVENKYGHDNCAHIITFGTMATKNSIKDVARVEKLPLDVANHLCKVIPDKLPDGLKNEFAQCNQKVYRNFERRKPAMTPDFVIQ